MVWGASPIGIVGDAIGRDVQEVCVQGISASGKGRVVGRG